MPEQRTTQEFAPPRTDRPLRQIVVFLCSTYAIAVAIAVALPHSGITPLLSIAAPALGFAITMAVAIPRVQRRAVMATVGFHPRRGRGLLIAVVGPVLIGALSFGVAAALGVVRFIFHLPLLLLTTTYQSAGQRWIVVPMVMITLTLAGVWYGWLRLSPGSIWPVCLSHSVFNNVMESFAGVAIVTSAATMAYVTTETGVVTMVIMVLVAAFLLARKGADFNNARPRAQRSTMEPRVDARTGR